MRICIHEVRLLADVGRPIPMMPKVSILMPVRDTRADWLWIAIKGMATQSYPNLELILSDNGSTKASTLAVLDAAEDQFKDRIVRTREAKPGTAYALDAALKAMDEKTVYVSKADSDDIFHEDREANHVKVLEGLPPQIAIVYSNFFQLNYHPRPWIQPIILSPYDYRACLAESLIPGNSMWRASVYDTVPRTFVYDGYEGRANRHSEDYAHWLAITDHFDAFWFDQDPALTWTYRNYSASKYWSDRKGSDYAKALLQSCARKRRGLTYWYDA